VRVPPASRRVDAHAALEAVAGHLAQRLRDALAHALHSDAAIKAFNAMGFIPGTHKTDQIPHRDTFAQNNLLTRGQEVAVAVNEADAVAIELQPGEMSLHHVRLVHGSPPNPSNDRRIGFAIRYIPTSVAQIAGEDSATLVRGVDNHHHFELEPRPAHDMDPAFVKLHKDIAERSARILYRGTGVKSYNDPKALPDRAA